MKKHLERRGDNLEYTFIRYPEALFVYTDIVVYGKCMCDFFFSHSYFFRGVRLFSVKSLRLSEKENKNRTRTFTSARKISFFFFIASFHPPQNYINV